MDSYKILVADSNEASRKLICKLLYQKGYRVYEGTDGAGTIRISRSIFPDLVILDINLVGMKVWETAYIIECDKLSTVIFITNTPNEEFYSRLKNMNIFAYIEKPINKNQLYQMVHFSIMNSNKINSLSQKIEKLENTLESRKKIEKAKGILMRKLDISEDEAYKMLRKKSMDTCTSINKIAEDIIAKDIK